jgi:hypothetical protein
MRWADLSIEDLERAADLSEHQSGLLLVGGGDAALRVDPKEGTCCSDGLEVVLTSVGAANMNAHAER